MVSHFNFPDKPMCVFNTCTCLVTSSYVYVLRYKLVTDLHTTTVYLGGNSYMYVIVC